MSFYNSNNMPLLGFFPQKNIVEYHFNRIFVGKIDNMVTEDDLISLFTKYGNIVDAKIVRDVDGKSKGYGFITFETPDEANSVRAEDPSKLEINGKYVNIGPAFRKQRGDGRLFALTYPTLVPFGYPVPFPPAPYPPFGLMPRCSPGHPLPNLNPIQQAVSPDPTSSSGSSFVLPASPPVNQLANTNNNGFIYPPSPTSNQIGSNVFYYPNQQGNFKIHP